MTKKRLGSKMKAVLAMAQEKAGEWLNYSNKGKSFENTILKLNLLGLVQIDNSLSLFRFTPETKIPQFVYGIPQVQTMTVREVQQVERPLMDTPAPIAEFYRKHIEVNPLFNQDKENFFVFYLDVRRCLIGFEHTSMGTLDSVLVHPRDIFRGACVRNASAVVLMHNHPSGNPMPSEADIKVTRDLIRAGQMMRIDILDHIVMGKQSEAQATGYCSLREMGYFYV